MSKKNRKMVYDKLVSENGLDRDDGSLVKEFGEPSTPKNKQKPKEEPKKETPKAEKGGAE